MKTFSRARGEGPPLKNEVASRLAPRGDVKGLSRLAFNRNDITLTSWAVYAARRRLHRKRLSAHWPAEVVS